jgi:hypothetical protein
MADHGRLVKQKPGSAAVYAMFTTAGAACAQGKGTARGFAMIADGIRAEMVRRIDVLDRCTDLLDPNDVAAGLETLRRIAASKGMQPAVTVIHLIDSLLARGERGALVHGWLSVLRDAASCDASDPRTCETIAAACAVRLGH